MTENTRTIALTQGFHAIVDAADFEWLRQWKWQAQIRPDGSAYAVRTAGYASSKHTFLMHRVIMGEPDGMVIDHINHIRCDNRRANLRVCTHAENLKNRNRAAKGSASQYLGVSFKKASGKWRASICIEGKARHIGYFTDETEAARAYDNDARIHHGDFANPNFPTV